MTNKKSRKERDFRYNHSDKGRQRRIRYNHSYKGKLTSKKYEDSPKGKWRKLKYRCEHTPITTEKLWRLILSGYK